jgi:hypothetical protein
MVARPFADYVHDDPPLVERQHALLGRVAGPIGRALPGVVAELLDRIGEGCAGGLLLGLRLNLTRYQRVAQGGLCRAATRPSWAVVGLLILLRT